MKRTLIAVAIAGCCALAGAAGAAIGKDEAKAQRALIQADYQAAKERCGVLKDHARDICRTEAKGNHRVARAELDARNEPSPRHDEKLRMAKADAAYELAKEKCEDLSGTARDTCKNDAKAAFVSAKADAKVAGR